MRRILSLISILVATICFALASRSAESSASKEHQCPVYNLDSIDALYVKQPVLALEQLDSLRRRCESEGWGDVSQQRLEMITAIAYKYLENPAMTIKHCYRVIELSQGTGMWDIWWRLMAYEYICSEYKISENWYHLAINVDAMDSVARAYPQYKWAMWYRSLALILRGQVIALKGDIQDGIEYIKASRVMVQIEGADSNVVFYNKMQTTQAIIELNIEQGYYARAIEENRDILKAATDTYGGLTNDNYYGLLHVRSFASLTWLFHKVGEIDSAATYYDRTVELRGKFEDGYSVIEPLAKYLRDSKQYRELDSLLLPIFDRAHREGRVNSYLETYMLIYLESFNDRGLVEQELKWAKRLVGLQNSISVSERKFAQDSFETVLKSKEQEKLIVEQEAQSYQDRVRLLLLLGACLFLLVTTAVAIYLWRKQQRDNRFLYKQSQEINENYLRIRAMLAESSSASASSGEKSDDNIMQQRIKEYLLDGSNFLDKDVTAKSVQDYVGTNYETLNRHFDALVGMSCTEYILMLRLEHSCQLLSTTNMTIDAVADESGFSSSRTFYRQFKSKYNISPTSYRKVKDVSTINS